MYYQFKIASLVLFCLFSGSCIAEKNFNITLIVPVGWDQNKVVFTYDNGEAKTEVPLSAFKGNKISISGIYFSKYASITAIYIDYPFLYEDVFFIQEKPATIVFYNSTPGRSIFKNHSLTNVVTFKNERNRLLKYDSVERSKLEYFERQNLSKVYEGDEYLGKEYRAVRRKKLEKDLEFIRQNSGEYYFFWYFKQNIAPYYMDDAEIVWDFFKSTFPDSLRHSMEGERIETLMKGRVNTTKNHPAPDFAVTDIFGNKIGLKDYRDKSYVLLVFWATTCVPCMKEMPDLKDIRRKYTKDNIEMIFMSNERDSTRFANVLADQEMTNWVNVYNDRELYFRYGYKNYIPQVYLIDKKGQIVYCRNEENDIDLKKLQAFLKRTFDY